MRFSHLVKDSGGIALYTLGPGYVCRLSRDALLRHASVMGDMVRRASRGDAAIMEDELVRTVDMTAVPYTPRQIVRRAYRGRMLAELEVLRYGCLEHQDMDQVCAIEGREHLDEALAQGKGAIVMIGHFGANQMIMPALGYRGYAMNQLSAPPTAWSHIRVDDRVNRLWETVQRRRWSLEQQLPTQHIDVFSFLRPAFRALKRGEVLGLAFDGGGGRRWIPMPLGRRTAMVSMQPWQLARTTAAPILPAVVVRDPGSTSHRLLLQPSFTVAHTADRRADVEAATQHYGQWFSEQLIQRPDHYLMYLLLRRRVRSSDEQPLFDDYDEV